MFGGFCGECFEEFGSGDVRGGGRGWGLGGYA